MYESGTDITHSLLSKLNKNLNTHLDKKIGRPLIKCQNENSGERISSFLNEYKKKDF
jgi:hypothetical protein